MKKNLKYLLIVLVTFFFCNSFIKAEDYSGGSSANLGALNSGRWATECVGLKINILNSSKTVKKGIVLLNSQGLCGATYFSNTTNPKIKQDGNIKWVSAGNIKYYTHSALPAKWTEGSGLNIYEWLSEDDYVQLRNILEKSDSSGNRIFNSFSTGDYILIEPMTYIAGYYGTVYEITNSFDKYYKGNVTKLSNDNFWYNYSKSLFGGTINSTSSTNNGGVFFSTIFLEKSVSTMGLEKYIEGGSNWTEKRDKRNDCFMTSTCGLGIGAFSYDSINDEQKPGEIMLIKRDANSRSMIFSDEAHFKLDSSEVEIPNEKKDIRVTGYIVIEDLPPGEYTLEEIEAPNGYIKSDEIKTINVKTGRRTTVTFYNDTNCDIELAYYEEEGLTAVKLFELYKKYNKNGLLNFEAPKCETRSCNSSNNVVCLGARLNINSFGEDEYGNLDLSCYDYSVTDASGDITALCKNSLDLRNVFTYSNTLPNTFYGMAGESIIRYDNLSTKINYFDLDEISKRIELKALEYEGDDVNGNFIAYANVSKLCYYLDDSQYETEQTMLDEENSSEFKVYFGDNDQDEEIDELEYKKWAVGADGFNYDYNWAYEINRLEYIENYYFYMKPIDLKKITGKIDFETINPTRVNGMVVPFNKTEGTIPFKLEYNGENIYFETDDNQCTYKTIPMLIKDNKLELEFRVINTTEPFAGKNGNSRYTNANWCDGDDCTPDNDVVQTVIKNAVNSFGIKEGVKQEPIYKITLTSEDIRLIRKFNKDNKYDNYELYCYGEDDCTNSFIKDLSEGFLNKYKLSGNTSVVEKSYGTISELIIQERYEPILEDDYDYDEMDEQIQQFVNDQFYREYYFNNNHHQNNVENNPESNPGNNVENNPESNPGNNVENNTQLEEEKTVGTVRDIASSNVITRGKQDIIAIGLRNGRYISSCSGSRESIVVDGTRPSGYECLVALDELAPFPNSKGTTNRYWYKLSIVLQNGDIYESCIRVAATVGKWGLSKDRDFEYADMSCCTTLYGKCS